MADVVGLFWKNKAVFCDPLFGCLVNNGVKTKAVFEDNQRDRQDKRVVEDDEK